MLRNIKFVTIFLLFLSSALIDAKAEAELTWEECLGEAKENNPELISARQKVKQARANRVITKAELLPRISTDLSGRTSKTSGEDERETYSYGITANQLLFDGFKTKHNLATASEEIKSAQYSYNVISSNVRLKLKNAFIKLLKAQQLLDITKDIAARRKENLELVNLRYEAGREHKGSLLNAQANLAQANFEVAQARRDIDLARRQLTNELGRRKLTSIKAKGNFKIEYSSRGKPDFECLAESNPFLLKLIAKKDAARFGARSAKADFFPEVYGNASAESSDSRWPPNNDAWSAGVSLSFPIFEGGSRIGKVSKARAALSQTQADERSGRDSVIFILEETWKEWQDAIDKVEVEQKFLEAAEERAKITQAQYSTGLISFDNWSIIEDNLVNAKKSFLNAKAYVLVKEAEWVQAKGGTLDYAKE